MLNFQDKAIARMHNSGIVDLDVLVQAERALLGRLEELAQRLDDFVALQVPSNFPTRHITRRSTEMRERRCHRPEIAHANIGTGNNLFSSLVSQSTSWPAVNSSKLRYQRRADGKFLERTNSLSTGAWRLEKGRTRSTWTVFVDLHKTLCVAGFCTTPS